MIGHELAVEQGETPDAQARHQPGQRHLGRIRLAREHALPEKGAAERYAVETADQPLPVPAFYAVRMAHGEQPPARLEDRHVDPRVPPLPLRLPAQPHHVHEGTVGSDTKAIAPDRLAERAGDMEARQRQDRPPARLHPEDIGIVGRMGHRKYADAIGPQQHDGIDDSVMHGGCQALRPRLNGPLT